MINYKTPFYYYFFFNIKENSFQGISGLNHTGFLNPLDFSEKSHTMFKKFSSAWPETCEQQTVRVVFILNISVKVYTIQSSV